MRIREYRFQATISLPGEEPNTFELTGNGTTSQSAMDNAKQLILREEQLTDDQEQYIKLEKIRN